MVWAIIATVGLGGVLALLAVWSLVYALRTSGQINNQVRYLISGLLIALSVPISLVGGSLLARVAAPMLTGVPLPVGPEVVCNLVCAAVLAFIVWDVVPTDRELYAGYISGRAV
ncbi:hypothetical protein V6N00_13675 [Tersicoccus sp. MR15.9]|uniref:hypothetical protein n=1 Tax=Tersicoccus mangrovi TaxID=3121635 RepID=UPI002FE649BE